jgi:membrane protease subunit (stomatin/prohibitin family)
MNFEKCYNESRALLMEGAVAERIKHEFAIKINDKVALADLIYKKKSRQALTEIYTQYLHIAEKLSTPVKSCRFKPVRICRISAKKILIEADGSDLHAVLHTI